MGNQFLLPKGLVSTTNRFRRRWWDFFFNKKTDAIGSAGSMSSAVKVFVEDSRVGILGLSLLFSKRSIIR
jgi:hypothetical protein